MSRGSFVVEEIVLKVMEKDSQLCANLPVKSKMIQMKMVNYYELSEISLYQYSTQLYH